MGHRERASCAACLQEVRWEPFYRLQSCQEQFEYFQATMDALIEISFPFNTARTPLKRQAVGDRRIQSPDTKGRACVYGRRRG